MHTPNGGQPISEHLPGDPFSIVAKFSCGSSRCSRSDHWNHEAVTYLQLLSDRFRRLSLQTVHQMFIGCSSWRTVRSRSVAKQPNAVTICSIRSYDHSARSSDPPNRRQRTRLLKFIFLFNQITSLLSMVFF